jgi:hypothetical protein
MLCAKLEVDIVGNNSDIKRSTRREHFTLPGLRSQHGYYHQRHQSVSEVDLINERVFDIPLTPSVRI